MGNQAEHPKDTDQNWKTDQIEFPDANIIAVSAISGALESAFGPQSMEKLVVTELEVTEKPQSIDDYVVSSDGATILEQLPLEHPIAPIIERIVGPDRPGETDVEGKDIPDGITSTVVLLSALLDEAKSLLKEGIHPRDVERGYRQARQIASQVLKEETYQLDESIENAPSILDVARSAITGADVGGFEQKWADLAVEAVDIIGIPTEYTLAVRKIRDGSINDSRLVRGAVLDRNHRASQEMPDEINNANILVLGGTDRGGLIDPEPPENLTAEIESQSTSEAFSNVFDPNRNEIIRRIIEVDADVIITRQGINTEFEEALTKHGIIGIQGVTRLDLRQVTLATGARKIMTPTDISREYLGQSGCVKEVKIEPRRHRRKRRRMMVFEECPDPRSVAILLQGVPGQIGERATTQVRKAAAAVARARGKGQAQPGIVTGGGAIDIKIAREIRSVSTQKATRSQLAMEAYATAIEKVVAVLARNGGLDPISTITELRKSHASGDDQKGLVFPDGEISNTFTAGVVDPVAIRHKQFKAATAVANLLLSIDDAIDAQFDDTSMSDPGEAIYDLPAERHRDYQEGEPAWKRD